MQKGFFRRYCKTISKEIIKYGKNYIREIIDEFNVKSFTKYKYNFLCEFIGSFAFVFFISIYMLHSNSNEEYIITHKKQINPYDNNDIFINNDELFLNNKFVFNNEEVEPINEQLNIIKDSMNMDSMNMDSMNMDSMNMDSMNMDSMNMDSINMNDSTINESNELINNVLLEKEIIDIDNSKKVENDNNIKKNIIVDQPLIKEVENVTFKDSINEYSKIKISDIDNIDLENIDKYEKLSNSQNIVNTHHSVYTIIGCLIYVIFVILGAHINPAYTYALWFIEPKKYGFILSTFYVAFQYLGGIIASILVAHIYGSIFIYSLIPKKKVMKIFVCETLCTFVLTIILINLYLYKKKFIKESKLVKEEEEKSMEEINNYDTLHFRPIKKFMSTSNIYNNFGSYENIYNGSKKRKMIKLCIENRYVKYIMNHIFYLIFILSTLLFFIFITSTTLNPMFTTSTLHTYLYFKLFKSSSNSINIMQFLKSFLSVQKIIEMIIMYIYSLPFWIGPYVGSAIASFCILLIKNKKEIEEETETENESESKIYKKKSYSSGINEEDDEDINVIDSKMYKKRNDKKEKLPLLNTLNIKHNSYLIEYNNHMDQNINFIAPQVY